MIFHWWLPSFYLNLSELDASLSFSNIARLSWTRSWHRSYFLLIFWESKKVRLFFVSWSAVIGFAILCKLELSWPCIQNLWKFWEVRLNNCINTFIFFVIVVLFLNGLLPQIRKLLSFLLNVLRNLARLQFS